ncbi:chromosome partitioning protein [Egicoccus sp. AB-alg2]|uniref:chromosome partitioning protein n=1 Tax=Egicoccus sp. AB-alg2 TaxID=3242693 RepID=UPI00359CF459
MTVVALASVKASPGVTTSLLALAATWPGQRPVLLVDADPDGGSLAARTGLLTEPGLTSLAAAARRTLRAGELERHTQPLPGGGVPALVGPADPEHASRALQLLGGPLATALRSDPDRDGLVDCGRLRAGSPAAPLAAAADVLVVVARPRLDELQHLRPALPRLLAVGARPALLLVGEGPYPPGEVAAALDVTVLTTLPHDPAGADQLSGQRRRAGRLERTTLLRAARAVAEQLRAADETTGGGAHESSVSDEPAPPASTTAVRERSVSGNGHRDRTGWVAALTRGSPTAREPD